MTNFEFYKDKFCESTIGSVKGKPIRCQDIGCEACDWCYTDCDVSRWNWLKAEYKESEDYTRVKVDTPILVSQDGELWHRRYFARYKEGRIYAWTNGVTSWSADGDDVMCWRFAKLAEVEGD